MSLYIYIYEIIIIVKYIYICHGCGFACQQRLLKTFPGPGCLRSEDEVA